jgi:hypothetical protein
VAIVVVKNNQALRQSLEGRYLRHVTLNITGLTAASPNTVPHTLGFAPRFLSFRPGSSGLWSETQSCDASNLYITVGTAGATSGNVDYDE